MRVLVTGASGHVAGAVIPELLGAGHAVTGLARSDRAAEVVRARGAGVRRGALDDLDGLRTAAAESDGVIHLAFPHDGMYGGDMAAAVATDLRAVEAMGAVLAGSGRPFVGTNATGALALAGFPGRLTERDVLPGGLRIDAENVLVALAGQDVRTSVVRLPPTTHGAGRFGFVSGLVPLARTSGVAGYVGDGSNVWPSAHIGDVARLYRLALESAPAGSRWHAVAEEGVALRDIAAVIGCHLNVPADPVTAVEEHFGFLALFVGMDNPTSSTITRDALGWVPSHVELLADLDAFLAAQR